ncbi:MAG TPA: hypothetical protein VJB98_03360 [Candidatus Paceibacterota bacterium]
MTPLAKKLAIVIISDNRTKRATVAYRNRRADEATFDQRPYESMVEIEGQTITLPFTNTFCLVTLMKEGGKWYFVDRQIR